MITKEKTILDILNGKCEKQLMRLYFIGKVRAKKILDYNKKINNINELKQILNISNQTITKIRKTPLKSESKKTKQHENETKQLEEFKRGLCNYHQPVNYDKLLNRNFDSQLHQILEDCQGAEFEKGYCCDPVNKE